jgi:hypothetical protein
MAWWLDSWSQITEVCYNNNAQMNPYKQKGVTHQGLNLWNDN